MQLYTPQEDGGEEAVRLRVAEQYVDAFGRLAQRGTTTLLPTNLGDPASMITQAMSIYNTTATKTAK
jgi:hypothetical protein